MFRSRTGSSCLPEQVHQCVLQRAAMPSDIDLAKRELVKLLKSLAAKYKVHLELSRDSSEQDLKKAFRKVSVKAHPDKGGDVADFQKLSAANDSWQSV